MEQNNDTNQCLYTIGSQLERIETVQDKVEDFLQGLKP